MYGTQKDFRRRCARSARRFKKSAHIRPESVISMGGYHAPRTQRVDLLDRVGQESGNEKPPDRMGLFQPEGWEAAPLLLARMQTPLSQAPPARNAEVRAALW